MITIARRFFWLLLLMLIGAPLATPSRAQEDIPTFHCALHDESCPAITILGDPPATLGGTPAPFRGYGDPSLELDPLTGELWLSYSWLDVLVTPGNPPLIDLGVRSHLARSADGGRTFEFVRAVNETRALPHPHSKKPVWTVHEVSTLARQPDANWQLLWLAYFDHVGRSEAGILDRLDIHYRRAVAASPADLADDDKAAWIADRRTAITGQHDLRDMPALEDCAGFTEPALFVYDEATYLATTCVVLAEDGRRQPQLERVVLMRETAAGYDYAGVLLDGVDAARLGADRLEQADLSVARDGAVILIVTPIKDAAAPPHQGCVVFTVADITQARLRRDANGNATPRFIFTAEGSGLGPGLCTYEATSATGVLLVIIEATPQATVFTLHATGVHP